MIKPESISEQLMYTTVRLQTSSGSGTGFFYNFKIGDYIYPTIITNKHVVNYKEDEAVTFHLHLSGQDGNLTENYKVTMMTHWYFHSNKDICFTFINPVFEEVKKKTSKTVFFIPIDERITPSKIQLESLSALEEVVMVGYPIGLWDSRNNLPIFRKGYTASHPAIDFNEDGIGLVDMACFPGSSGSPIFILNEGGYKDKKGNLNWGQSRVFFLGILYAGPQYNAAGDIVVKIIPTSKQMVQTQTPVMANLGYYVKSAELNEFKHLVETIIEQR